MLRIFANALLNTVAIILPSGTLALIPPVSRAISYIRSFLREYPKPIVVIGIRPISDSPQSHSTGNLLYTRVIASFSVLFGPWLGCPSVNRIIAGFLDLSALQTSFFIAARQPFQMLVPPHGLIVSIASMITSRLSGVIVVRSVISFASSLNE